MRKIIPVATLFFTLALSSAAASPDAASIVASQPGCTWFVAGNAKGFYLLQWFGGRLPFKGDAFAGEINNFGIKDVYYRNGQKSRFWIDNFWLTANRAADLFAQKCP